MNELNNWSFGFQTDKTVLVSAQRCLTALYVMTDSPVKSADVSSSNFPNGGDGLSADPSFVYRPELAVPACLAD